MALFPKLATAISLLLTAALGVLSFSMYRAEVAAIQRQNQIDQQSQLASLIHIAQESLLSNDDLLLVKYARWLARSSPAMTRASVVDSEGDVLAHSEPSRIGHPEKKESRTAEKVWSAPIPMGAETVGTASVAYSQDELHKQLRLRLQDVKRRLIQVTLVITPLAIGFSLWVALSWSRPIQHFVALTQKIGQGRWEVDLDPVSRRGDELGGLARSLKDMAIQLRELDQMKDDFISVVTHELRSPLGAIESYLHLIAEELEQNRPVEWDVYLKRLRLNTQRLNRFVTDLLDVAALERGKVTLQLQRVDLCALAQDVLHLFAVQCRDKQLQCRLEAPDPCIWVRIDPDKIRQVLINLVANAVKFTPAAGIITLTIEFLPDEDHVLVQVKDTGIGIAVADQAKIFNKFEQVASARRYVPSAKGTGLGLAICRSLIELHGHELGVRSQFGHGSAFFFKVNRAGHV